MEKSNFTVILTEASGNYAIPDIEITTDFQTSFSIQNAADISKRKDTLTQALTFPGTKNNNRIFNNLFSLNREADSTLEETLFFNYSPVVAVRAILYENNYPLVVGMLTINDIVKDKVTSAYTYSGIITGKIVSFFGSLRDALLTDLNIFPEAVTIGGDVIMDSWIFGEDKNYILPSIDYGKGIVPTINKFDIRNFRPGIYARQYFRAILGFYNYKYTSSFIDSDIFNRAYIPYAEQDFGGIITGDVIAFNGADLPQINMNRDDASTVLTGVFYNDIVSNVYVDSASETAHGINGGWGRKTVKNDRTITWFKFKKASKTGAVLNFNFDIFSHAKTTAVYIQIFKLYSSVVTFPFIGSVTYPNTFDADSPIAESNKFYGTEAKLVWTNVSGTVSLPVANYDKDFKFALVITTVTDKGDNLELRQNSTKITFGNPDVAAGSVFSYDLGDTFSLNEALPKGVKVIDFLKSMLTTFNMYIIEDPNDDRKLIIEPYDVFYKKCFEPAKSASDWTKKIDNSSLHITNNTALPKAYGFKFAEDSDFYNTLYKNTYGLGYGNFTIDNKIGTADEQDIPVIFAATVMVTPDKDDKTMAAIWSGELLNKTAFKSKPRILFNNGVASCSNYDIVLTKGEADSISTEVRLANFSSYNVSHHVLTLENEAIFNLVFGLPKAVYYTVTADVFDVPTLYSFAYSRQLIELDDINIFTLKVDAHLRPSDISTLDLSRPIFIWTTQGAAYFKIMSVVYFNSQEVSNLILQKIIL